MSKNEVNKNTRDGFMKQSKISSILPSPAMLESYEEIAPGIVDKLVDLVEKEQKHRHSLEEKALKCEIMFEKCSLVAVKGVSSLIAVLVLLISFLAAKLSLFVGMIFCLSCYTFLFFIEKNKKLNSKNRSEEINMATMSMKTPVKKKFGKEQRFREREKRTSA
ncbi:MAG: hypothetical protein IRF16MM_00795 [Candidatus Midichloria mitochondrii]|nr:DUF2335 domain-containing protein [Candidatus Midichloria mitochondrii]